MNRDRRAGAGYTLPVQPRLANTTACSATALKSLVQVDAPWYLPPHLPPNPAKTARYYKETLRALTHADCGGRETVIANARASLAKCVAGSSCAQHIEATGLGELLRAIGISFVADQGRIGVSKAIELLNKHATTSDIQAAVAERLKRLGIAYTTSFKTFTTWEATVTECATLLAPAAGALKAEDVIRDLAVPVRKW
jgi:hypothetical protein